MLFQENIHPFILLFKVDFSNTKGEAIIPLSSLNRAQVVFPTSALSNSSTYDIEVLSSVLAVDDIRLLFILSYFATFPGKLGYNTLKGSGSTDLINYSYKNDSYVFLISD